jgi:hypothetical protein
MRRREFITLLSSGAAAWPFVASAQPIGKSWHIGQVIGGSAETNGHFARAIEQRLGELGYRLGGQSRIGDSVCESAAGGHAPMSAFDPKRTWFERQ